MGLMCQCTHILKILTLILATVTCGHVDSLKQVDSRCTEDINKFYSYEIVVDVLIQFLSTVAWNKVLIISDVDDKLLLRQLSQHSIKAQIFATCNKNNFTLFLRHRTNLRRDHVIVFCNNSYQQQLVSSNGIEFTKELSWLFVYPSHCSVEYFLRSQEIQVTIRPDSEIFVMVTELHNQHRVYHVSYFNEQSLFKGISQLLHPVAKYYNNSWALARDRRPNFPLQDQVLNIGIFQAPPICLIEENGTRITYSGYIPELIELLAKYMRFRYKFIIDKSASYGSPMPNKSWTGLMGMILRKEINLTGMNLAISQERQAVVAFTAFTAEVFTLGMMRKPGDHESKVKYFTYLSAFPKSLWLLIIAFFGISFACLTAATVNENSSNYTDTLRVWNVSVKYSSWTIITIAGQTGITHLPKNSSSLVILGFILLFVVVVSRIYCCFLTAFLTVKQEKILFNSLEDVLEDNTYGFLVSRHGSQHIALENAESGLYHKIWTRLKGDPSSLVGSKNEAIDKIYKEKYVFIYDNFPAYYCVTVNCSLTLINRKYLPTSAHMVLSKQSPYIEALSQKVLAIRSAGIQRKHLSKYFPNPDTADCPQEDLITSIGLKHAIGAFLCLLVAVILSVCCLVVEIFIDLLLQYV